MDEALAKPPSLLGKMFRLSAGYAVCENWHPPRAVLFDFDGSLAQSEEAHRKRFVAACGVECDVDRWMDHCAFFADVALTAGARELLEALGDAGVPCAIVSSGLGPTSRAASRWGLEVAFVVAGDDAEPAEHKPSPEPYLYAAAKLGVDPLDCVCVEDSPSGIEAALAAGIPCVALRNPANAGRGDLLGRCTVADDAGTERPSSPKDPRTRATAAPLRRV
ncbi:hypothetical protein JL722_7217 [Aureococcus anophagefferens]|nr:hypothetical protein JL722_7217 [Aureococcus anophagefferens]